MADRPLVAIYTCHRYNYHHPDMKDWLIHPVVDRVSALRDTWLQDVDIDYRMFSGQFPEGVETRDPQHDEVFLGVPDNYYTSNQKTRAIARWALANNYNRLLKIDDDVYLHWNRMRSSYGFSEGEYVGGGFEPEGEKYAAGGCYWLGERALEAVASSPASSHDWAEDRWVGSCMERKNIPLHYQRRYYFQRAPDSTRLQYVPNELLYSTHNFISFHAVHPDTMRAYHTFTKTLTR